MVTMSKTPKRPKVLVGDWLIDPVDETAANAHRDEKLAEIQAGWTESEERRRRACDIYEPADTRVIETRDLFPRRGGLMQ